MINVTVLLIMILLMVDSFLVSLFISFTAETPYLT